MSLMMVAFPLTLTMLLLTVVVIDFGSSRRRGGSCGCVGDAVHLHKSDDHPCFCCC